MKKLLILAFILYAFPSHSVVIDVIVCTDHVYRTTTVYRNVKVKSYITELPPEEINDYLCWKINQGKINKRGN